MSKKKYASLNIMVPNARLSFPAIAQTEEVKDSTNSKPYWGGGIILDPEVEPRHGPILKAISKFIKDAAIELWGRPDHPKAKDHPVKFICKGEDKVNMEGQVYTGCESPTSYYVTFRGDGTKPRNFAVFSQDKEEISDDEERMQKLFYSGANVDVMLNLWVQDDTNGRVPRCGFKGIRFRKHNEPFGSSKAKADDFEDLDDDDVMGDEEEEIYSAPKAKKKSAPVVDYDEDEEEM